jgi:hypothetical protein
MCARRKAVSGANILLLLRLRGSWKYGIHVCAIVYTDQYVLAVEHVQTSHGMCRQIRHIGREGEIPKEAPLDRLYSSQINSSFKSPAAHARLPVSVAMEPEDRSRRIIKKQSAMPAYISLSRARSIGSRSNRNPLFRAVLQ